MQYSSQMSSQRLQNESVPESSRGHDFKVLLSPASCSPPALRVYDVGLDVALDHHRYVKWWTHRSLHKYVGELTGKQPHETRSVRWMAYWRSGHLGLPYLQSLLKNQVLRAWEKHCSTVRSLIQWSCWLWDRGSQRHSQWHLLIPTTAIAGSLGGLEIGEHGAQHEHPAFHTDATSGLAMLLSRTCQEKKSQTNGAAWPTMGNRKRSGEGQTVSHTVASYLPSLTSLTVAAFPPGIHLLGIRMFWVPLPPSAFCIIWEWI